MPDTDTRMFVEGLGEVEVRVAADAGEEAELDVGSGDLVQALLGRHAKILDDEVPAPVGRLEPMPEEGRLRFVRDKGRTDVRRWLRADVDLEADCFPEERPRRLPVKVRDLSAGGALLAEAASLPLGMRFDIVLPVGPDPDEDRVRLASRIIRARDGGVRAASFLRVDDNARRTIDRFVKERLERTGASELD